jgi:hypothetical protein
MPQIPNPLQDGNAYSELKRNLKYNGFGYKHNYEGAKLIKTTRYTWPAYSFSIVHGPSMTIPEGSFCAYVYIYPEYETRYVNITKTDNRVSKYYEDNIDEVLGGPVQTPGG